MSVDPFHRQLGVAWEMAEERIALRTMERDQLAERLRALGGDTVNEHRLVAAQLQTAQNALDGIENDPGNVRHPERIATVRQALADAILALSPLPAGGSPMEMGAAHA